MATTKRPHSDATMASRVRPRRAPTFALPFRISLGAAVGGCGVLGWLSIWLTYHPSSHRPNEDGRPPDDSNCEKQHDQHAERERDRDRALAAAFLLRLGEDDPVWLLIVGHCLAMRSLPDRRCEGVHHDLEQQGRKQREQIQDRERE